MAPEGGGKKRLQPAKQGTGKRKAFYNSYVQRDRQEKYYEKKKVIAKLRRSQRFDEKQEKGTGKAGDRRWGQAADDVDDEYERRLALSFGGEGFAEADALEAQVKQELAQKKNKKRRKGEAAPEDNGDAVAGDDVAGDAPSKVAVAPASARGARRGQSADGEARPGEVRQARLGEVRVKMDKKKKKQLLREGAAAGAAGDAAPLASADSAAGKKGEAKEEKGKKEKGKKEKLKQGAGLPGGRFAKELRQHREAQEAREAEFRKREEEAQERNRKRKDHAKDRAKKAQLLSQTTRRGQPKMKNRLDALLKEVHAKYGG